ncbi:MAG: transglutaminase-like cysteine peptidase [Alphaproteobacteria bacterium]
MLGIGRAGGLGAATAILVGLAAATLSPLPAGAANLVYGNEPRSSDLGRFTRWVDALNKHVADMTAAPARCQAGDQAYCFLVNYDNYLDGLRSATPGQQIAAVNRFVNQIGYVEDRNNYGVADYWASPLEFFRNAGDCEDFAIAKYVAFRRLGYSDDQVRVWVVRDQQRAVDHAVLTVATGGRTYLLDSLTDQVLDAQEVSRYQPIYSINASAWWLHDMDLARQVVAAGAR